MQLGAIVSIIPWEAVYMFRVLVTPIIRSVLKLYMQLLVQYPSLWGLFLGNLEGGLLLRGP
jgi:hypothetical protein